MVLSIEDPNCKRGVLGKSKVEARVYCHHIRQPTNQRLIESMVSIIEKSCQANFIFLSKESYSGTLIF